MASTLDSRHGINTHDQPRRKCGRDEVIFTMKRRLLLLAHGRQALRRRYQYAASQVAESKLGLLNLFGRYLKIE